jgi:hypothetical protein
VGQSAEQYRGLMAQQSGESELNDESSEEKAIILAAYDLDGDGEVGVVEGLRAELGIVDARLEEIADEGGITGKIANAAHHVVDRLDND